MALFPDWQVAIFLIKHLERLASELYVSQWKKNQQIQQTAGFFL